MNALPFALWRSLTFIGLFGLILLITVWNGWLAPIQQVPLWLELLLFVGPLALLIRGIWRKSPRTHVHATLLSLVYMSYGFWYLFTPQEERYGTVMLILSITLYVGCFFSAKKLD